MSYFFPILNRLWYVVFRGHRIRAYTNWTNCNEHVIDFHDCSLKQYEREEEVEDAFKAFIEFALDYHVT